MKRLITAALLLSMIAVLVGCVRETDSGDDKHFAGILIKEGKRQLAVGSYTDAEASFDIALTEYLPGSAEALYGRTLARLFGYWALIDMLMRLLLAEELVGTEPGPAAEKILNPDDILIDKLLQTIVDLRDRMVDLSDDISTLQEMKGAIFKIDSMPIYFLNKKVLDLGGVWGAPELTAIGGGVRFVAAALSLVTALDLKFDLPRVWYDINGGRDLAELSELIGYVAELMRAHPEFLALREGGAEDIELAKNMLMLASIDMATLDQIVEWANIDDGVLTIESENARKAIAVRSIDPENERKLLLSYNYPKADFLSAFESIAASVEGAQPVGMRQALVPILTGADFLVGLVGLDFLGSLIGADIITTIKALLGDEPGALVATASDLVGSLFPIDAFAFDLGAYFTHPIGPRDFLPPTSPLSRNGYNGFLVSYECPIIAIPAAGYSPGATIEVEIYDLAADLTPGAAADSIEITARSLAADGASVNSITMTAEESNEIDGLFLLELATAAVTIPVDGRLEISYGDFAAASWPAGVGDGASAWKKGVCSGAATDLNHFGASYYQGIDLSGADGSTAAYPEIAADGIESDAGYIPFGSPSYGGLLVLDLNQLDAPVESEPSGPATPRGLNILIRSISLEF